MEGPVSFCIIHVFRVAKLVNWWIGGLVIGDWWIGGLVIGGLVIGGLVIGDWWIGGLARNVGAGRLFYFKKAALQHKFF